VGEVALGGLVGIVLGAGSSTRLGRPKQLLPLGPRTVLSHVVGEAEASHLDRVVAVVGGGGADEVVRALTPSRATIARNEAYGTGCASSLLAGLDAAGECEAIVLLLGDMPGVSREVIDTVVRTWLDERPWAAVTAYRDAIGHPFVFSAAAFPTLRELHGDKAVWKIVDRERASRVARIHLPQALPDDIDTWDDYVAVCSAFGFAPAARTTSSPL
jgi:molybdenum cofactor cytidylyltransferase